MAATGSTQLVGRLEDLRRIGAFLGATVKGPAHLLLEGEPGIGKTTLWRAGVERARELGIRVLQARPAEPERELSFAALGDLLSGTHEEIGRLPLPQRRALRITLLLAEARGDPPDQHAVGAALLGLLRRLAERESLLIALDDMQWLDPPSADALQFALRRLNEEPVRVLGASRTDATFGLDDAERIEVGPLGSEELYELVRAQLGARFLRPTLHQLEDASGGNPFYALEIASALLRSGTHLEPGEPLPIPARLREAVRERLATLTPAAREAALATAALAQPTLATVKQLIAGAPAAVSEAMSAGVLDRSGETVRFTHPLFASTLYEDTPLEERRELHLRLAEVVDNPEERARHLAGAADGPDESVAAALEAAAASVMARGARDVATKLAKQAVDLTPSDRPTDAHRRCLSWARYSVAAGDPGHAEKLLEGRLELARSSRERAETEFELGRARLATGGISAARACFEHALLELEDTDEVELRAATLIELADVHIGEARLDSNASERAVALAEQTGKPDLLARALGMHGTKLVLAGDPPSDEYWRRALEIEEASGELRYAGPTHAYSFAAFMRGDANATAEFAGRVTASMRRSGDPKLGNVLIDMAELARILGDWEAAARYADEAHDLIVQTGQESHEPVCVLWKARLARERGDLDDARRHAEEAMALVQHLSPSDAPRIEIEALAMAVLGGCAELAGRNAEAHECFTAAIEGAERITPLLDHALAELLAVDVECLLALGALEEASRQLERLLTMSDALGIPTLDAISSRARGLSASANGDSIGALRHLGRAVESFEALPTPWPLELARTLLALGGVQRRARQKLAARHTLGRALEIFERLGARLWVEKTRTELSQIGGRPSRPGALTATEQSIADLVVAGRSNAEVAHELFLSPKTVEWNLSKIYKKLHVRSRTELAAKLTRQRVSG